MRKPVFLLSLGGAVVFLSAFTVLHSSGSTFTTGSPFDSGTCGQCHTGVAGSASVTVSASPVFGSGNTYMPGNTYTVSAVVSGTFTRYGFNLEVLNSNSSITTADAGVCGPALTSNCQRIVFSSAPTNYTHTSPSGSANSATFSFLWTAPSSGPVYIYCAGLGVNNSGTSTGDKVTTYSVMLSPTNGIEEAGVDGLDLRLVPNPASDLVQVFYTLKERGQVLIRLIDLEGHLISNIFNEEQVGGTHTLEAHLPEGLSKGPYFIELYLDGKQSIKKLMVN